MTLYSSLFHHNKRIKPKLHLYSETTVIFDISSHVSACMRTDAPGARLRVRTNAPGVRVRVQTKSLMLQTNTPALSD